MLLAGSEVAQARRVYKHRTALQKDVERSSKSQRKAVPVLSDDNAEQVWQAENKKCGTQYLYWCEEGPSNPHNGSVHRCAYQPLLGDILTTTKCRVTDDWMLKGTEEKHPNYWLTLQVNLLKAQ